MIQEEVIMKKLEINFGEDVAQFVEKDQICFKKQLFFRC